MTDSKIIKDVWGSNLVEQLKIISTLTANYFYVSIDTEFPGFLPDASANMSKPSYDQTYSNMKTSVNKTKLIQFGISIADINGNCGGTWQFNLKFSSNDAQNPESIHFLKQAGLDFESTESNGIDHEIFVECFKKSSLFKNPKIIWISYHGCYHYAHMLKHLSGEYLPGNRKQFYNMFHTYFPTSFDIKHMTYRNKLFPRVGGLQKLSEFLGCQVNGSRNHAGPDALLVSQVFFQVCTVAYIHFIPMKHNNVLYQIPYPNYPFGFQIHSLYRYNGNPLIIYCTCGKVYFESEFTECKHSEIV